ncbi:MAG: NAD(P)-binding domain-containing protein [Pseudomonadota bacterium]|nr:NAD(P)-binding domain-containing protein [Pseudomonadota bacterium]
MTIEERIAVIGGAGWLGGALIRAAVSAGAVDPTRLTVSARSDRKGAIADIPAYFTRDNQAAASRADIVILSVPPPQFRELQLNLGGRLVVSVMAGVSCQAIASATQAAGVVRALPNAAASIGQSFTPWFATEAVSQAQKASVQTFFQASGDAVETADEAFIDYFTGMTGSGAAFPALLAEALAAHAVSKGIPASLAQQAARKVVAGASQLFAGPHGDAGAIVKEMIDYRGVVAAALQAMLDSGFNQAVAAGLQAAANKAASIASS